MGINYIQQYRRCLQHNKRWLTAHSLTWRALPYGLPIPYISYILHLHILYTTILYYNNTNEKPQNLQVKADSLIVG